MKTEKVLELRDKARDMQLVGWWRLYRYEPEELARIYNGIGAEWMTEKVVKALTKFLGVFGPAAQIHDVDFHESDGSKDSFEAANDKFLRNCRKCAKTAYGWWRPRRYAALGVAKVMFKAVSGPGGWVAWRNAYERKDERHG